MVGWRRSHYRIEERLGAGGRGDVYRARDEKLGRDVPLVVEDLSTSDLYALDWEAP